jgi:uncharacterized LabA/DUF88 family protein
VSNFLYVDNSNVWIEGMHVKAVAVGSAPDIWTAQEQRITERWKMDFGRLFEFAGGGHSSIGRAVLYGSRPPANDSLWVSAERQGFEVVVYDRSHGREKKIDTRIATDIVADSFQRMQPGRDEVTLVSGDSDYVPTVENLRERGFEFHLVFWDHASRELREACNSFTSLNQYLDHLTLPER